MMYFTEQMEDTLLTVIALLKFYAITNCPSASAIP